MTIQLDDKTEIEMELGSNELLVITIRQTTKSTLNQLTVWLNRTQASYLNGYISGFIIREEEKDKETIEQLQKEKNKETIKQLQEEEGS